MVIKRISETSVNNMQTSFKNIIGRRYCIESKVGNGKFGQVYRGMVKKTNEMVAIKVESLETPIKLLKQETTLLNYMAGRCVDVVPSVYWYGIHENTVALVMPFYEITLDDYYKNNYNNNYTKNNNNHDEHNSKGATQIANHMRKMIEILKHVHDCGVIHRDIKPSNFMMKGDKMVLIDFGLASIYVDESGKHLPEKPSSMHILGTPKFISVHIHNGGDASRRDDMISLCYIYFYLANHYVLPWDQEQQEGGSYVQDSKASENPLHIHYPKNVFRKQQKVVHFHEIKNGNYPILDKTLLEYCYQIKFHEKPLYQWLVSLFHSS